MNQENSKLIEVKLKNKNDYKNILKRKLMKFYYTFLKEDLEKENKLFIFITLVIYMVIICIACFYHEAWEDESQAWLIARDLSPLEIIKQMRFEGHSCMWHFMLLPFAKLRLPFDAIKIIPIIAALITGYLVLTKSPFNRLTKICTLFSSTFLYYIPVIVRPYSLLPLLFTLISIMNSNKKKYPMAYGIILAILANIHVIMLPFTGMLFLYYYGERFIFERKNFDKKEKRRFYIGLIISIIGIDLMFSQALAGYIFSLVKDVEPQHSSLEMMDIFSKKFVYYLLGIKYMIYAKKIFIMILLVWAIHTILISQKQGFIFWVSFLFWIIVHCFVWRMILNQRIAVLFLFIFYYAWNYRYDIEDNNFKRRFYRLFFILSKSVTAILVLLFVFSIRNTYNIIKDEIKNPYSGGKEIAEYLINNAHENSVILTNMSEYVSPIVAYTAGYNFEFYEVLGYRNFTFKNNDKILHNEILAFDKAIEKYKGREMYIVFKLDAIMLDDLLKFNPGIERNSTLIYQSSNKCNNGVFYLWKVNSIFLNS